MQHTRPSRTQGGRQPTNSFASSAAAIHSQVGDPAGAGAAYFSYTHGSEWLAQSTSSCPARRVGSSERAHGRSIIRMRQPSSAQASRSTSRKMRDIARIQAH